MYKLRFQKAGPYQWGDINVVVGDINAIHTLYNSLVSGNFLRSSDPNRVVAEVSPVTDGSPSSKQIYAWGAFRNPGDPVFYPEPSDDD